MAPLLILLGILLCILGNTWFFQGMPVVKPFGVLLATCFISWFYFLLGLPIILTILTWKYKQTRKLTNSLVSSVVMILAFYASAILTWSLISRGWNLSFPTTLKAAGGTLPFPDYGGKLDHAAEGLLASLLIVSTLATIVAGVLTVAVRHLRARCHRVSTWQV